MMNLIEREWDIPIRSFNDPKGIYFNVGNGCISRTDGGYVLLNRIQNHWTSLGRHHPSQKNPIQTVSFVQWIDLDMEYNIVHSHIIDQSIVYEQSLRPVDKMFIIGLEDMRLFKTNIGGWGFIASTGHFGSWDEDRFWGQALGTLTSDRQKINWIQPLSYKNHRLMEKNWLPFMVNNELRILYETSPMTVLHLRSGGECATDYMGANTGLPVMRGSGSPIPWGENYLYTIHEQGAIHNENPLKSKYFYFHRFIEMDPQYNILRISPLFIFREEGVEYTCGHCLSHDGKSLLIPYSSSGGTDSNLMSVSIDTVERMLDA